VSATVGLFQAMRRRSPNSDPLRVIRGRTSPVEADSVSSGNGIRAGLGDTSALISLASR
jgi:hypothetical protein